MTHREGIVVNDQKADNCECPLLLGARFAPEKEEMASRHTVGYFK
jgi:hypothetical protein